MWHPTQYTILGFRPSRNHHHHRKHQHQRHLPLFIVSASLLTISVRLSICSAGLAHYILSAFRPLPLSIIRRPPLAVPCWPVPVPRYSYFARSNSSSPEPATLPPWRTVTVVVQLVEQVNHQPANACPGLQLLPRHQPAQPVSRVSLRLQPQKVPTPHPQNSLSWDQLPCNPVSDWAPLDVTHASALLVALRGAFSPRFRLSNQIVDFST